MLQWRLRNDGYAQILWGQLKKTLYRVELAQENDSKARGKKWPKPFGAHDFTNAQEDEHKTVRLCFPCWVFILVWFSLSLLWILSSFWRMGMFILCHYMLEVWNLFLDCIKAYCKEIICLKIDSPLKPSNNVGFVKDSTIAKFELSLNSFCCMKLPWIHVCKEYKLRLTNDD